MRQRRVLVRIVGVIVVTSRVMVMRVAVEGCVAVRAIRKRRMRVPPTSNHRLRNQRYGKKDR